MPRRTDRDWKGVIASLLVHAVILFLIVGPIIGSSDFTRPDVIGGGGVGSGEGPGRGSGIGPGTGGGPGKDYPPTVRDLFIPPMPAPQGVKGFHMKAFFDVDEKGNAKLIGFNPTRDGDYNRRVAEVLRSMRFRPGVHPDGTPKRDTAEIEIIF